MTPDLAGKTVVLGVTGGIAAYKAAELCRLLVKAGAQVRVVMTEAACQFITPLTMQALSGHAVAVDLFATVPEGGIGHIELASRADIIIIAPATADAIARFAAGMASDLLAAVVLATQAPILLAPAMNTNMWENPITQDNLARLCKLGRVTSVGPDAGDLACGWVGAGRMVNPQDILTAALVRLGPGAPNALGVLSGQHVVVTAGPTWEAVDDVRFLGNRSSGKMGFALAAAAARLGAQVTLIAGPVALATPPSVAKRIDVESALELREALQKAVVHADVVVMAAAVADFRPGVRVLGKLSRRQGSNAKNAKTSAPKVAKAISLVANPDLLAELGRERKGIRPYLIGFAAEVGVSGQALIERARAKLVEKACDVIVANEVGRPGIGFGADENAVTLVLSDGRVIDLPPARKELLAQAIWDKIAPEFAAPPRKIPNPKEPEEEPKLVQKRANRAKGKHA
ncbi:MAG TPA: bifunctional phosphopantothenoylcysteine decarboxylase/phosphopantothenate--cysteine ligase CoaBC [Polyangia bacterium]|jgi:phosphopantothenoylcysteine decarboxylase/phosphopantothenate--cysteine ligase